MRARKDHNAPMRLSGVLSFTVRISPTRKKAEALFAEPKNQIGLRRLRLLRLKFVWEHFFLRKVQLSGRGP